MVCISQLGRLWRHTDDKIDVFMFFDHERYIENIVNDFTGYITILILAVVLIRYNPKVFIPFAIYVVMTILSYYLFYAQYSTNWTIPVYLIFASIMLFKWKKIERLWTKR